MNEMMSTQDIASFLKLHHMYVRDRLTKHPEFPRPTLMLSTKIKRWAKSDIERWLERHAQKVKR